MVHFDLRSLRELMKDKGEETSSVIANNEKQIKSHQEALEVINSVLDEHREVLIEFTDNFKILNGISLEAGGLY